MKNTLYDLNNHLFAQLERMSDENLTAEEFEKEFKRSQAITALASQVVNNAKLDLDARKVEADLRLGAGDNRPRLIACSGAPEALKLPNGSTE